MQLCLIQFKLTLLQFHKCIPMHIHNMLYRNPAESPKSELAPKNQRFTIYERNTRHVAASKHSNPILHFQMLNESIKMELSSASSVNKQHTEGQSFHIRV